MGFHDGRFPVKTNQKKQSEAFLVKGAFFKSAIRRLDKFFVILKPIKVLSVADPRPNQVGVRFGLVSVSLRSCFGLVSEENNFDSCSEKAAPGEVAERSNASVEIVLNGQLFS